MKPWSKWLGALLTCVLALTLLFSLPATAEAATYGDLTYSVSNGEVTITDCSESASGDLVIPDTIEGYPVTSIGNSAFSGCSSLTSVTIPDSVTSIGASAFYGCSSLTGINIPDSITSIGSSAFNNCSSLAYNIYDNANYLGNNENPYYALINATNTNIATCNVHTNTKLIAGAAFSRCYSLTSITIPNGVTSIGSSAFYYCYNMTSVDISNSVISIGSSAFHECRALTSVTIGNGVTNIGESAFEYCTSLKTITIPDSVTTIDQWAFASCSSLESITIPDSVTSIGREAFCWCIKLTSISVSDGVNSIEKGMFYNCTSLNSVTIPESVTTIEVDVFYNCNNLSVVLYKGTEEQWNSIAIDGTNRLLFNATRHYVVDTDCVHDYLYCADCDYSFDMTGAQIPAYTVQFKNWDGTVLSTGTYHYGDTVTAPETPTKAADNTYTYPFAGWDKPLICNGNSVITATYTPTYIDYTVIFKDEDGAVISQKTYHYGDMVEIPTDPTKAADNTYTYAFSGWDTEVSAVSGDATYTATYTPTYIDYTVTFKDWDGTVLSEKTYHYGDAVEVPADPTRAADNTYTYAFNSWDQEVIACAGDTVYTATYTPTYIEYTVIFKDWDSTVLSEKTYHYGDTVIAPETPTKAADNTYTYPFAGWDKPLVCAGDDVITATYTPTYIDYTVIFKDEDGAVISEKTYHYGDTVELPTAPTKAADNTYTYAFSGWDTEVSAVSGDATYTATYTPTYIDYTVTFKDWDGFTIEKKTYHYGDTVTVPADPIKAGDRVYTYTFTGWDPQVTVCTADAVYTATYSREMIDYVVTFQNADGTVISQKTYHYGDTVEIPTDFSAPEGYRFVSWDKEIVTTVDENAVYTAIYELDWLKGDFDSSGSVDDADALYLLRHTLFADRYPIPGDGDVDSNGSVDDADALYLLRHTLFSDRYPLYPTKEEI